MMIWNLEDDFPFCRFHVDLLGCIPISTLTEINPPKKGTNPGGDKYWKGGNNPISQAESPEREQPESFEFRQV